MSANEFILSSKQYLLDAEQRSKLTLAQQRGELKFFVDRYEFTEQEKQDIARLEARKARKSPRVQKLKLSGAETVILKKIEEARAKRLYPDYANPRFARKGSPEYLGQTVPQIERAIQNLESLLHRQQREISLSNLQPKNIAIRGDLTPETLATLRLRGLI